MLTRELIQLIRDKPITDADLRRASMMTLDALVNALAGRNTQPGRKLLQWGSEQGEDAGRRALVAGGLTHILETDDLHRASVTHPGCVVPAAVLFVAEREQSGASAFLRSILHGFEAMCRVGLGVGAAHYRIWHNTATCGPYGSAMAIASLLQLSDEQAEHALGNAGTQSAGLWQFLETGAMSKHLHAGRAAEAGIVAADLAALGFTGPPGILDGQKGFFAAACPDANPAAVVADANAPWQLALTSIKPWPSCRHTHPAIDVALELRSALAGKDIESIEVQTYQAALDVCNRPRPGSEYQAKFSLHHCVAAALADGELGFDAFGADARDRLAPLRAKTCLTAREPWDSAYPQSWGARVVVTSVDGTFLDAQRSGARGDPELALSDGEMVAKAHMLLAYAGYERARAQWIIDGILGLAHSEQSGRTAVPEIIPFVCRELRLQS
jgi:2-methylcitrate dehydratase PrpD